MAEPNPFDFDNEDDETTVPQAGSENANFKQLRDYAKKQERELKTMQREVERLKPFETQAKVNTLKNAGLSEKHAALFEKVNPGADVTPELVQSFVTEYEIPVASTETATEVETLAPEQPEFQVGEIRDLTPAPTPGFAPTPEAGQPSQRIVTDIEEAQKLAVANPAEYARLHQAGRIQLQKLPGNG